jgi:GNAT superfamily N-acetyltransferase
VRYQIRRAVPEDVSFLPGIEQMAGTLFDTQLAATGLTDDVVAHVNSVEDFEKAREAGRLWVAVAADGRVVGFALVLEIAGYAHLEELDVLPAHGRRGVGSSLLSAVCTWAAAAGYPAITLRTFRDIPWNAPFYRRRGFEVVDSSHLSDEHVEIEALERQRGLRTDRRVSMKYSTGRR